MKKLNLLNKIYLVILILVVIATAVRVWEYGFSSRYYYSASITAPRTFPVKVRDCYFILADGEMGSIADSDVNDHRTQWGNGDFEETHRKERLPVKLVLEYCSYRDQKFYRDTINLPAKMIDSIFNTGKDNRIFQSIYAPGANVLGLSFLIGIANEGNIVVWLHGASNYEKVLLKHRVIAREPVGDQLYYEKQLTKPEYLKKVFEYMDEETERQISAVAGKKENYIDSASNYQSQPPTSY